MSAARFGRRAAGRTRGRPLTPAVRAPTIRDRALPRVTTEAAALARTRRPAPTPAAPPAPPAAPTARPPWYRAAWFLYVAALAAVLLDQATKLLTEAQLALGDSIPLIPGWFAITHVQNEGAAFSMFDGQVPILAVISSVVTIGIIIYERRLGPRSALQNVALACILGGAVGNLVDRVRVGRVVDMFDLQNGAGRNLWPVFNVADIALVVGVGLFVIAAFREGRAARRPQPARARRRT